LEDYTLNLTVFDLNVNQNAKQAYVEKRFTWKHVFGMLVSRLGLFTIIQSLTYLGFMLSSTQQAWVESARWWPLNVALTNILCMILLEGLLRKEGKRFTDFFEFRKGEIKKNFLIMSGLMLLAMPIAMIPNIAIAQVLFGNYQTAIDMFYVALPSWAAWLSLFIFPLTMPLGELTVYFGYVMPRLEILSGKKSLSFWLPVLMLSLQHIAVPLLFDVRFIVWRALMFLPFAFFIGILVQRKPKLLPYLLVGHFFIDLMTAVSLLMISLA
jgi:hypothetical protein